MFPMIGAPLVMVNVLASCAVDRGFESRSGQTKDYKICICCFSAKHTSLRRKSKDWLARNQDNVRLHVYLQTVVSVGLVQSGPHHHLIEN